MLLKILPGLLVLALIAIPGCSDDSPGTNDNTTNPICGNGQQENSEECDGADLGGETCQSQGLTGGTLACYGNCTFDPTSCDPLATCGNGTIDAPQEQCDGTDLAGETCQSRGYIGGPLLCSAITCQYSERECDTGPVCGDGGIDTGEQCDGINLNEQTCESRGYASGTLSCSTSTCLFDESACVPEPD